MKKTSKQKQMTDREWIEYAKGYLWIGRNGVYSIAQGHPDAQPRAELKHPWSELAEVLKLKHGNPLFAECIYQQTNQLCMSAERRGGLSGRKAFIHLDQARMFLLENYADAERILIAGKIFANGLDDNSVISCGRRPSLAWSISIDEKKLTAHPNVPGSLVGLLNDEVIIPGIKPGTQIKIEQSERSVAWEYARWAIAGAFFGAMVIGPLIWR